MYKYYHMFNNKFLARWFVYCCKRKATVPQISAFVECVNYVFKQLKELIIELLKELIIAVKNYTWTEKWDECNALKQ